MPSKIYGYAKNDADVATLQAYAGVDIIVEDMEERGQYRILRRFLWEGDTLGGHLSALGDSDEAIRAELDGLQKQEVLFVHLCKSHRRKEQKIMLIKGR